MKEIDAAARAALEKTIQAHRATLEKLPGVLGVRVGFPFVHGWIVKQPSILVYVDQKKSPDSLLESEKIPRMLDGQPVHVVQADPEWQLGYRDDAAETAAAAAAAAALTYKKLPGDPIDEGFVVEKPFLCHVGPDAG